MDDWLRDGLDDVASESPTGTEVPHALVKRARVRMTLVGATSLIVAAALVVGLVAGVRVLARDHRTGRQPTPSIEPPRSPTSPSGPTNVVTVTLSNSGCTMRAGEIEPGRVRFVGTNTADDRAVFDIGIIEAGHSVEELAAHVDALDPGLIARAWDDIEGLRPSYFRGSLVGRSPGGGRPMLDKPSSLLVVVTNESANWTPVRGAVPPGSTLAAICYRWSAVGGALVPAGLVGPVVTANTTPEPTGPGSSTRGVLLGSITMDDDGCHLAWRNGRVDDVDYVRFTFSNHAHANASFDIGRLAEGFTFDQLAMHLAPFAGRDDPRWRGSPPRGFVRIRESFGEIGFPHGGMGPHIGNPFGLRTTWTADWTGPGGDLAPVGRETFVVICYRDEGPAPGQSPVAVIGPFEVR